MGLVAKNTRKGTFKYPYRSEMASYIVLLIVHVIVSAIAPSFLASPVKVQWFATYIFGFTGAVLFRRTVLIFRKIVVR